MAASVWSLLSEAALGHQPGDLGCSTAFFSGPHSVSYTLGPIACPVSLLLTLSTLYLLDEDPAGSQAEPPSPAASGEASEKAPPPGPGPSVSVREQQPLSSLSSVLLYRVAPEALRLVFYDEVWSQRERGGEAAVGGSAASGSRKTRIWALGNLTTGSHDEGTQRTGCWDLGGCRGV